MLDKEKLLNILNERKKVLNNNKDVFRGPIIEDIDFLEKRIKDGFFDAHKKTCKWYAESAYEIIHFSTSCEEIQHFVDGGIKDNGYKYCPYCGKQIEEVQVEQ